MSSHNALWKKYMSEVYDKLDLLFLQPAAENRRLPHHERQRRLSEIEMIFERMKLLSRVAKRKNSDTEYSIPFIVDQEGNC